MALTGATGNLTSALGDTRTDGTFGSLEVSLYNYFLL